MKKIAITLILFVGVVTLVGAQYGRGGSMQKLLNAQYAINNFYVDTVNEEKLIEEAIKGRVQRNWHSVQHETRHALRDSDHRGRTIGESGHHGRRPHCHRKRHHYRWCEDEE